MAILSGTVKLRKGENDPFPVHSATVVLTQAVDLQVIGSSTTNINGEYYFGNVINNTNYIIEIFHENIRQAPYTDRILTPATGDYQKDYVLPYYEPTTDELYRKDTRLPDDRDEKKKTTRKPTDLKFSGTNARAFVYVADTATPVELDVSMLNFTVNQMKLPLYGYKSLYMDSVAVGTQIIQGSFILNMKQSFQLYHQIKSVLPDEYSFMLPDMTRRVDYLSNLLVSNEYPNSNITLQEAIIPIFLDIQVNYYSPYNANEFSTGYKLVNARIVDITMVVTHTSEPIGERYTFIANDLIYF